MTFLPIVERELRVAARRPGTYWTRWFVALGMMAVWVLLGVAMRKASHPEANRTLFLALGILAFGIALFGVWITARMRAGVTDRGPGDGERSGP